MALFRGRAVPVLAHPPLVLPGALVAARSGAPGPADRATRRTLNLTRGVSLTSISNVSFTGSAVRNMYLLRPRGVVG